MSEAVPTRPTYGIWMLNNVTLKKVQDPFTFFRISQIKRDSRLQTCRTGHPGVLALHTEQFSQ